MNLLPDTVLVPAGSFLMGSTGDDELAGDNEHPQNTIELPAYRIGRYPLTNAEYALDEGREDLEAEGARVLRGGSWFNNRYDARCASRLRSGPDVWLNYIGFRAVIAPALL